jgi:hypothetical protein
MQLERVSLEKNYKKIFLSIGKNEELVVPEK